MSITSHAWKPEKILIDKSVKDDERTENVVDWYPDDISKEYLDPDVVDEMMQDIIFGMPESYVNIWDYNQPVFYAGAVPGDAKEEILIITEINFEN
jgi:hypothetical protein